VRVDGHARGPAMAAFAGPDLARAEDEVAAIAAARSDCDAHTGAAAGREELTRAMGAATVVHVAAHGQHRMGNPLFSSLRLADGALFAHELDRSAPHVVLSACELGLATVRTGDEALGLTSVLLHLGTRSVISGVARVSDEAAAQAMTRYHAMLDQGRDTAEALADAVVDAGQPLPFVCFGAEWKVPVRAAGTRGAQSIGQLV
jgi:CHAT domain-containing protein